MVWFVVLIALMIPLIAVILDSQLGRALAARLERDRLASADQAVGKRLAALEGEVERLALEVQRLEEEGAFMRKLLEGKPAAGSLPPNGDGE